MRFPKEIYLPATVFMAELAADTIFFNKILLFVSYGIENFLCFPTLNVPRVIFNGFQDILPDVRLGRESSLDFPM